MSKESKTDVTVIVPEQTSPSSKRSYMITHSCMIYAFLYDCTVRPTTSGNFGYLKNI